MTPDLCPVLSLDVDCGSHFTTIHVAPGDSVRLMILGREAEITYHLDPFVGDGHAIPLLSIYEPRQPPRAAESGERGTTP
jgi:hypothetical protein